MEVLVNGKWTKLIIKIWIKLGDSLWLWIQIHFNAMLLMSCLIGLCESLLLIILTTKNEKIMWRFCVFTEWMNQCERFKFMISITRFYVLFCVWFLLMGIYLHLLYLRFINLKALCDLLIRVVDCLL